MPRDGQNSLTSRDWLAKNQFELVEETTKSDYIVNLICDTVEKADKNYIS